MLKNWPTPTTIKEVRGFLGWRGIIEFISGFGGITAPLTKLLSKDKFHWTTKAVEAFQMLKETLTTPPMLQLPDFSQIFVVESDACGAEIGATLM